MNLRSDKQSRALTALCGRKVLSAVITYNPDGNLPRNIAALRAQSDAVVIIDNGSANLVWIEKVSAAKDCWLLSNSSNLGVATALNQAARMARERGFDWLATFDQDSLCPPGAINCLLDLYQTHPLRHCIGVVALSHRDRSTGRDYHHRLDILVEADDWREVRSTITSGNLIRVGLFDQVGLFDDALFIDSVDHDFCLRIRRQGWRVIESRHQVLEHSIGDATERRLLGLRVVCTHHSPLRRYYMTRNQLEVSRRNILADPVWAIKGVLQYGAGAMAALLYEGDKLAKLRNILTGFSHFVLRRFGPRA